MKNVTHFTAGLPQLDIHTLSEDWALAAALENHWRLLADDMGLRPSQWIDTKGDRMYGAVISLSTHFDLANTIGEDDKVAAETEFLSIRKPHALSRTRFVVNGQSRAEIGLLSSFIKRKQKGSNKKFAKVRDLWTTEDFNGEKIDALLDRHHQMKDTPDAGGVAMAYEVNRIQDFNTADFMYFKNYVRIAKAAEWRENRSRPTRLNTHRECFYYGNVEDGQTVSSRVARDGDAVQTSHHADDGRRIFLSLATCPEVEIAER
jgi:probable biosynthetic protein (TIGR04098 family)